MVNPSFRPKRVTRSPYATNANGEYGEDGGFADYVNVSGARRSGVGLQKGQRGTDYLTSRLFDNFARGRVIKLMITNDHVS